MGTVVHAVPPLFEHVHPRWPRSVHCTWALFETRPGVMRRCRENSVHMVDAPTCPCHADLSHPLCLLGGQSRFRCGLAPWRSAGDAALVRLQFPGHPRAAAVPQNDAHRML